MSDYAAWVVAYGATLRYGGVRDAPNDDRDCGEAKQQSGATSP